MLYAFMEQLKPPSETEIQAIARLMPPAWADVTPLRGSSGSWLVPAARAAVQLELPWFMGSVPLATLAGRALDQVICALEWTPPNQNAIRLVSAAHPTFAAALAEAIEAARPHGEDEDVDWPKLAATRTGGLVGEGVRFTNLNTLGRPQFVCTLSLPRGKKIGSGGRPTRREAFEDVVRLVARTDSRLDRAVADQLGAAGAVNSRIWRFEHGWLLALPNRTEAQSQRLQLLSQFLALGDSLRKYELDPRQLPKLQKLATDELRQHAAWESDRGRKDWLAMLLSSLFDLRAKAGATAGPELDFEGAAARSGLPGAAAAMVLLGELLLKEAGPGTYQLTLLGEKVLTEAGAPDRVPRKLADGLSDETVRSFAQLEQALDASTDLSWLAQRRRRKGSPRK